MTRLGCGLVAVLFCHWLGAQTGATANDRIDAQSVMGARLLAGGGRLPDEIYQRFLELAGGVEHARVVVIPTASATADDAEGRSKTLSRWQQAHPGVHFEILHTRDRAEADSEAFTAPLRSATGVWFGGGAQQRLADAYVGTRVERELQALLQRGGIVGGSSAGTAIQTRVMIVRGMDPPVLGTGLDLLPFAISDQHFLKRERLPRLVRALAMAPGHFGVGIDEGTAILVRGRDVEVLGQSKAVFILPAVGGKEQRLVELGAGAHLDLPTWQRAAQQRGRGPWPTPTLSAPRVDKGALVIVGGGRLPDAIVERFFTLAGGNGKARIVIVPTATPSRDRADHRDEFADQLRRLGAVDVQTLEPEHASDVEARHVALVDSATGIWFGGGRQWRIVDAFEGTDLPAAFHRVLARGGVIGGSSAGATIQGEFLVRGNPLGNSDMWCEGYDRGYGFLPGCAVDQHFVTRERASDMQALVEQLPQLIGLGIDESTAAVVAGSVLEVVGVSKVAVFDARGGGSVAPTWLEPGQRWDLVDGRPVR